MLADPQDTIVALSSASGPGARAIVRLSGPAALATARKLFSAPEAIEPLQRRGYPGQVCLPDITAPLPATLYVWPPPRTYTGQQLVELHVLSSPPLVELLVTQLLREGARAAQPGEFTLRAFLAGKLDLARAEAVLGVIEAGNRSELNQALAQLAGSVSRPIQELRDDLLDLLADVEAGLDFAEEDISLTSQTDLLNRLTRGLAHLTSLDRQLKQRSLGGKLFRAVLVGRPNAGKSSLFNALTGAAALVSPEPGTTRDYLVRRLELGDVTVELVDTAGWREATDALEEQAQALGQGQSEQADLLLLCLEAGLAIHDHERAMLARRTPAVVGVGTKCDQGQAPTPLATSALTGLGLEVLREEIARRARARVQPALAPSLSRCGGHVKACLDHLRQAHAIVLHEDPPELLALELRGALEELGAMVGAIYTDDLLDRIFSRFCIGK